MFSTFSPKRTGVVLALCMLAAPHALAGASPWELTDGGRVRMLVEAPEPGAVTLRGALQIELEQGWKTYWREPGSAGIPPSITPSGEGVTDIAIGFPAPVWVDDPYGSWAGYTAPVTLPLTITLESGAAPVTLETDVFLGICMDICIPVATRLDVPLRSSHADTIQKLVIDTAFASLPGSGSDTLEFGDAQWTSAGKLEITLRHDDDGAATSLFLSGGPDYPFKKPELIEDNGTSSLFAVEPLFDPGNTGMMNLIVTARRGDDSAETTLAISRP